MGLGDHGGCLASLLCNGDLIAQTQGNTLRLAANADVTADRTLTTSFNAQVGQCVLSKDASSIHVGRQESTVTFQLLLWCQAAHVGGLHNMIEIFSQIPEKDIQW